jgi:hypothetical protein
MCDKRKCTIFMKTNFFSLEWPVRFNFAKFRNNFHFYFAKYDHEISRNKIKISRNTKLIFGTKFREISYPPYPPLISQCCQVPPSLHCHFSPKPRPFGHLQRPHTINTHFSCYFRSFSNKLVLKNFACSMKINQKIVPNLYQNVSFRELIF